MHSKLKWLIWLLLPWQVSMARDYPVTLGNTVVIVRESRHKTGHTYVHLHRNETTALRAAQRTIQKQGGRVITLIHPGGRNIVFRLHHRTYAFDPNRIFTQKGIQKTLKQNGHVSNAAVYAVKKLSYRIKSLLPKQGKIIAVHNNQSYSMQIYLPGHTLAKDALSVHRNVKQSHRNFYLVTRKQDYQRLKQLNFNSILQATHARDDGSLSVYLAKQAYINVEAAHGQLLAQLNMLRHA